MLDGPSRGGFATQPTEQTCFDGHPASFDPVGGLKGEALLFPIMLGLGSTSIRAWPSATRNNPARLADRYGRRIISLSRTSRRKKHAVHLCPGHR